MAAAVMRSGADYVTIENFAVGNPNARNDDWDFQMYGVAGQSFHAQHAPGPDFGDMPVTSTVEPR
jgi:hypothetical protein